MPHILYFLSIPPENLKAMGSHGRFKLKFFHRSSHSAAPPPAPPPPPPPEFICPICNSMISDPVVVGSGHTFDSLCVQVCKALNFAPFLPDGSKPDFSRVIPNLAFKSTIENWCSANAVARSPPPDYVSVERIVRGLKEKVEEREMIDAVAGKVPMANFSHAVTEVGAHKIGRLDPSGSASSSSDVSVIVETATPQASPLPPFPLATRPACYSYSSASTSSSEISESLNPNPSSEEEDEFVRMLRSSDAGEQERGIVLLRKATRSDDNSRISLCTPQILTAIRPLLTERRFAGGVNTNAAAVVVNLSLDKVNKVKIVRSGILPPLIDLLKTSGGGGEAAEHAAGAIFSLALEDDNKTAIGVLGALPPLMHCLRSESERTRHDSALALYHLSLVQSNRAKLVKLGAVPALLAMLSGSGTAAGKALLVLCNLAASAEGRSAMLDRNAVECLVAMLRRNEFDSESTRENCVAALYALSHGIMRFKGLAREAGAAEALRAVVEERGSSERAREKARRILLAMKGEGDGGDRGWERILGGAGGGHGGLNSSQF